MHYPLHPIQTLQMVQNILPDCNPRIHVISAKAETVIKPFSPRTLQNCILNLTSLPPGKLSFLHQTDSCHLRIIRPDDVTFSCSGTRGALSYLPFPADREETSAHGDFRKWILKNIDDCFKIADAFGYGVNHMGDIVLVTGRDLARSWINVAFSGSSGGAQVSFKVQVTRDLHLDLEERDVGGAELKLGPSGEVRLLHNFELEY